MSTPAPLWEVFVRSRRGLAHPPAGSVHAADPDLALQAARDLYPRRAEGVSIWVVPSSSIITSSPDDAESLFEPTADHPYPHASYYQLPPQVAHM